MTGATGYHGASLWLDTLGEAIIPRPALHHELRADVVIVGAGFIGLWTAYCLAVAEPALDIVVLEAEIAGVVGSTYTPHCARVHPDRLVRGLAAACERRGVRIFERSPVVNIEPGRVQCATVDGRSPLSVVAGVNVQATEAFTVNLPGHRRDFMPVVSHMVATEPLDEPIWAAIGWEGSEPVADQRHLFSYGQRTIDGRIALGGVARAGGLAGHGVIASSRCGRTLADLILERGNTELTTLPWVGHHSRRWEPEPARVIAQRLITGVLASADRVEDAGGGPARRSRIVARFTPSR